jgi:glycosyltransferase involved in cell wall biosynthesis
MLRLGILTSHPIQYQVPIFRALAASLDVEVLFSHQQSPREQAEAGFNTEFTWDGDLLAGYRSHFLENVARSPGVDHFSGCDNPQLYRIIQRSKFDAFFLTGWNLKSHWQAVFACKRFGTPIIVRGDSHLHTTRSLLRKIIKMPSYRVGLRLFDAFLFVGHWNKEYLVHYGVPDRRMFFAPHCIDSEYFRSAAESARSKKNTLREELGISANSHVVLFVGRFVQRKGADDLIEALARIEQSDVTLMMVGSGDLDGRYRALAKQLKIRTHFAGFVNQRRLPEYYSAADILVVPSLRDETWGLVVNEAMATGLPAVVSDRVGCGPDLIDDERIGFRYPAGDVDALAAAIDQMLKRARCARTSRLIAEKVRGYSIGQNVEAVHNALAYLQKRG